MIGLSLSLTRAGVPSVPPEYPHFLFANGELGGWFDGTDRETARLRYYRTAITNTDMGGGGTELGMLLDKSGWQGKSLSNVLGTEVVTDPDLNNPAAWGLGAGWSMANGVASCPAGTATNSFLVMQNILTLGQAYLVTVNVTAITGTIRVRTGVSGSGDSFYIDKPGVYNAVAICGGATNLAIAPFDTSTSCTVESFSAKPLPGVPARQDNQTYVPKYKAGGWADHDGVDDKLTAYYPSSLGANCTVAYSTISGVTFLEAQTIGTSYDLPGVDWFEVVVINRALTGAEKSRLTSYLLRSRNDSLASSIAGWGDSYTAGTGASDKAHSWSNLLEGKCSPIRLFSNFGIGGSTVANERDNFLADSYYKSAITIFWDKRNTGETADDWINAMNDMVAALKTGCFLIPSTCTGSATSERKGGADYAVVQDINTRLAAQYPDHFLDIRRYLIDHGLSDAGLTPTAQDTQDIADDTIPTSLLADGVHLNDYGHAIAAQQFYNFLHAKGWV